MRPPPSKGGLWQSSKFLDEHLMAEAARQALAAVRDPSVAGRLQPFLERKAPKLAVTFKMPRPVGRGFRFAGGEPAPLEGLDEVLAVFGLQEGIFIHTMLPRARVAGAPSREQFGGALGALIDILEAEFFDEQGEAGFEALPAYDSGLLAQALTAARTALHEPDFPALPFVQEYANRHCDGSPEQAREWLRGLTVRLGRLTFGV